MHKAKS